MTEPDYRQVTHAGIVMGRGPDCEIVLTNVSVSRRHCRVWRSPDGDLFMEDFSRNGTYVNGQPAKRQKLGFGDHLTVSDYAIRVCRHDSPVIAMIDHQRLIAYFLNSSPDTKPAGYWDLMIQSERLQAETDAASFDEENAQEKAHSKGFWICASWADRNVAMDVLQELQTGGVPCSGTTYNFSRLDSSGEAYAKVAGPRYFDAINRAKAMILVLTNSCDEDLAVLHELDWAVHTALPILALVNSNELPTRCPQQVSAAINRETVDEVPRAATGLSEVGKYLFHSRTKYLNWDPTSESLSAVKLSTAIRSFDAVQDVTTPEGDAVMPDPVTAYHGTDPYIFLSYAHKDKDAVLPDLKWLHDAGYRVWYDEGIDAGREWPDEVAVALKNAACFVVMISTNAVESKNVRNEIHFALNHNKPFLAIHLAETPLPPGLELRMGDIQAIHRFKMSMPRYQTIVLQSLRDDLREPSSELAQRPMPDSSQESQLTYVNLRLPPVESESESAGSEEFQSQHPEAS